MDEEHDVRVLLERAGVTKIGEFRAEVLEDPPLRRARELRECDHRDAQLLREGLQASRDRSDLLLPGLAVGVHELQVVDEYQVETVLGGSPSCLSARLNHRERRGVVDEDWGAAETPGRGGDS